MIKWLIIFQAQPALSPNDIVNQLQNSLQNGPMQVKIHLLKNFLYVSMM